MGEYVLTKGEGRTKVNLSVSFMGNDVVVRIYNQNAHIGAVAVGEYEPKEQRVSTSVITRLGHRDDVIAVKTAYLISKHTNEAACVIVGIHVDDITEGEIDEILINTEGMVKEFISQQKQI